MTSFVRALTLRGLRLSTFGRVVSSSICFVQTNVLTALFALSVSVSAVAAAPHDFFSQDVFGQADSLLIKKVGGNTVYEWQAGVPRVPASLIKLATSHVAIQQWGLAKKFHTYFYRYGTQLWVKGRGDPYLVSEELDRVAAALRALDVTWATDIMVDGSFFKEQSVPGRSGVADPYNAPLAAVSANFNTAKLTNNVGKFDSAEPQTPITDSAVWAAKQLKRPTVGRTERINLVNANNAAAHVAEILRAKLALPTLNIQAGQILPTGAELIYTHENSHSLSDVVRGTLEFSNNFMANQLFLMLPEQERVMFSEASQDIERSLATEFGWDDFSIVEGAGLSRQNRLSAHQLNDLLTAFNPHKHLLKAYTFEPEGAYVRAKTGTLNGVRSFAGYITFGALDGGEKRAREYQFVFVFNRKVPYRYRENLLAKLVKQLRSADH